MNTFQQVCEVLKRTDFYKENITNETRLSEELGADSLDVAYILMTAEEHFGVVFKGSLKDIVTVGDIVKKVEEEKKEKVGKVVICSREVENQVITFLERLTHQEIFHDASLKSLGLAGERTKKLKRWAENHFGFDFSPEDKSQKTKTVGEFINLAISYGERMRVFN